MGVSRTPPTFERCPHCRSKSGGLAYVTATDAGMAISKIFHEGKTTAAPLDVDDGRVVFVGTIDARPAIRWCEHCRGTGLIQVEQQRKGE